MTLVVLFTSCSVDRIDEDNSIILDELNMKAIEENGSCASTNIVNIKGDYRGTCEAFIDYYKEVLVIKFTTVDYKIRTSGLFIGPMSESPIAKPGIVELGKFKFYESFKDGVYETRYKFRLVDIENNSYLIAKLKLSNDFGIENAWAQGTQVPGDDGAMFVEGFIGGCFKN